MASELIVRPLVGGQDGGAWMELFNAFYAGPGFRVVYKHLTPSRELRGGAASA